YEIQAIPETSHRSKIIVNVRTEGIPDDQLARYKASSRFALFQEIDELAAKFPPKSKLPNSGGVNFTLLPNEDLKTLARRVTGRADNWRQIAEDNGLKSPRTSLHSRISGCETVCSSRFLELGWTTQLEKGTTPTSKLRSGIQRPDL